MRLNTIGTLDSTTWGGQLRYGQLISFKGTLFPPVTIPLYIKSIDQPIRVPKLTEINTIPTVDAVGWSDGTAQALFSGGNTPLTTTMEGFLLTPVTQVTDSITNQTYSQVNPTSDGTQTGTDLGLLGYTYGDLIWAYIEGKMARTGPSVFLRVDPVIYVDPNGNEYGWPVLAEFSATRVPGSIRKETFSLKLYLET